MKSVVLDTNVLLDIFVFNDFRAVHLKQALIDRQVDALATSKTLEEFADVISRPLFCLEQEVQDRILSQWHSIARVLDDETLLIAPWQCQDPDDQVFLNLAYTAKPSLLISKDNEVLKLANRAIKEDLLITSDYSTIVG
ncbi:putative toxin-antitoxin system toxin component, PIN family [Polynucleobacter sp. MG-6-Vaara-E2]|jgi:putative PIN family toxin of toxin-antitoxin system|uniref:putative toxin-antitoxin system toxin component, PIN family n=1 Tax=Polynucleobacter sp. MG-6-Vaara-E2 TaxID=2576932 RepID=UPI001BFE07EB|nr:putative toxin-antitoxin system toxin component, PIN family [Polynucleobacter sp. MG-6-Vaara-E2]QWD95851.1 putative toxin-antitoxin system toxin component, PIN family [Polynucleobacter sp. MG-6-Vaara-E2]